MKLFEFTMLAIVLAVTSLTLIVGGVYLGFGYETAKTVLGFFTMLTGMFGLIGLAILVIRKCGG